MYDAFVKQIQPGRLDILLQNVDVRMKIQYLNNSEIKQAVRRTA